MLSTAERLEIRDLAIRLGVGAAAEIMPLWPNPGNALFDPSRDREEIAKGGASYNVLADRRSEGFIVRGIRATRPNDKIASEEDLDTAVAVGWKNDPLDGTGNFDNGQFYWGICIAYDDGSGPQVGVMVFPALGYLLAGGPGIGVERRLLSRYDRPGLDLTHLGVPHRPLKRQWGAYDLGYDNRAQQLRVLFVPVIDRIGYLQCHAVCSIGNGFVLEGLQAWYVCADPTMYDVAAATALVRGVGGVVTSLSGDEPNWSALRPGSFVAARTPAQHAEVLAFLNSGQLG